ncbi:hypothetical protein PGTUg99_001978 [Puccinia graminis f. sp. tritici]|uniref:Uncharacterized protein n=1 Tax=Puccinia graminis f. sp. tritici TaxID=56615 RepID=A0A5B0QY69_PUCGR|nr:hypothetical protein PGTUg99_001978 [Puccinia graminis f. sp. tritici]
MSPTTLIQGAMTTLRYILQSTLLTVSKQWAYLLQHAFYFPLLCQPATIQRQPDHKNIEYLETLLHILPP